MQLLGGVIAGIKASGETNVELVVVALKETAREFRERGLPPDLNLLNHDARPFSQARYHLVRMASSPLALDLDVQSGIRVEPMSLAARDGLLTLLSALLKARGCTR